MGSFADYMELKVLDNIFGATAMPTIANEFFALSSTDPGEAGAGITEPSGGSYARKSMANNKTTWGTAGSGQVANAAVITFATATADWLSGVDLGFWALFDAITSGNMICYGVVTVPKPVLNGDTAEIAVGACVVTLT